MYEFDYIIPVYNSGEEDWEYRRNNIVDIANEFFDLPVCVHIVCQGNCHIPIYSCFNEGNCHIYKLTKYNGPFNKSWLYNYGVNKSKTNNILLAETDVIPENPKLYFKLLKKQIINNLWAIAWSQINYRTKDKKGIEKTMEPKSGLAEGGIVYFDKDYYLTIGGANEFYRELGGIDNDIARRAEYKEGYNILNGTIEHLWHPKNVMKKDDWKHANYRDDNRMIYNKYTRKNPGSEIKRLSKYVSIGIGDEKGPMCSRYKEYEHIEIL